MNTLGVFQDTADLGNICPKSGVAQFINEIFGTAQYSDESFIVFKSHALDVAKC
jgi:hypothetical protein